MGAEDGRRAEPGARGHLRSRPAPAPEARAEGKLDRLPAEPRHNAKVSAVPLAARPWVCSAARMIAYPAEEDTPMSIGALLVLVVALTASPAWAHPGGLAADGWHYCRTNCAKWGQVEGERHGHEQHSATPAPRSRQNVRPPARPPQAAGDRIRTIPIEIRDSTPRIVDAATLDVAGQRVRLQGIAAPEAAQSGRQATGHRYRCGAPKPPRRCGRGSARARSRARLRARTVTTGRSSICYTADGTDLNGWLVRQGYALAYRRYSTKYVPQEAQARANRAGIWADRLRAALAMAAWGATGLNLDTSPLIGRSGA